MAARTNRNRVAMRPLPALLALTVVALLLPAAPLAAADINTGQAVTNFFNSVSGNFSDNLSIAGLFNGANVYTSQYGFRFPVKGYAVEASFDLQGDHGYKQREQTHNSQTQWNANGAFFNNTTSLFGIRLELDKSSPFFPPVSSNTTQVVPVGGFAYATEAGDFDGDGADDLAVLAANTVQVRLNRNGNFTNFTSFNLSGGTPWGIKRADLNLDGRMDFVAIATTSYLVYVYPFVQRSNGTMRMEGPITTMSACCIAAQDFAVGDLSGDGYPDLAAIYENRTVYLLNAFAGKNLDVWTASDYSVKAATASYGSRVNVVASAPAACPARVAVGTNTNNVFVYWQSNLTAVATLTTHTNAVNGVAWSGNCNYLATSSTDKTVLLWDTTSWTVVANLTAHTAATYAVAFSPDSSLLATGGADGYLKIWNLAALPSPPTLDYNISDANGTIYSAAFSPNGSYIAAGTANKTIRLRATSDYSLVANLTGHTFQVVSVAYSPDGLTLVSGSYDDKMFVWNMSNLTKTLERTQSTQDVNRVAFSPNGSRLITASSDGHVRVYLASDWSLLEDITEGSPFVYAADFDKFGLNLLTGGTSNFMRLWDKSLLLSTTRLQTKQEFSILAVAYSPAGWVASAAEDGTVTVTNPSTGAAVQRIDAHNGTANAVSWSPDGGSLATGGSDGLVRVFNTTSWNAVANLTLAGNVTSLDFAPGGGAIAGGSSTGNIRVWSTSTYTLTGSLNWTSPVNAVAYDPTGVFLVTGANDGAARVWDVSAQAVVGNLTATGSPLRSVDWSGDGQFIAVGGNDNRTRIFLASDYSLVANWTSHTNTVSSVAFSPDSTKLATAGYDARIYTWALNGTLLQQFQAVPSYVTRISSISWSNDSKRIAAGWADSRFPVLQVSTCSMCSSSMDTTGIAIGEADGIAGNDIVVVGRYADMWNPTSGAWRLNFASGSPGSWTNLVTGTNAVTDAYRIAIGDLTGDGRNDVAIASDTSGGGSLYFVSWNVTTSGWDSTVQNIPIGGDVVQIAIADVTGDGHNDVVLGLGANQNDIQVAFYEATSRPLGAFKISNVSKYDTALTNNAPSGFTLGRLNNDTLLDVAASMAGASSVWIYYQKDTMDGYYVSPPLVDGALPGFPFVSARLWWDDFNAVAGVTTYSASISADGGFTWTPVAENDSISLPASNSTTLQYRFDFHSESAGVTAWITQVTIVYVVEATAQGLTIDLANDAITDASFPGAFLGLYHIDLLASVINTYVADNIAYQDANGTVFIPIRFYWQRPAILNFTNLSISYNAVSSPPTLIEPGDGAFAPAAPIFHLTSTDTDGDVIKYHIQISTDPTMVTTAEEYDQNASLTCWGRPGYIQGVLATCTLPDADRLVNGQTYYWRAAAFDGLQWSQWSAVWRFTVDDLAPEGYARSPTYSTVETFTVTWQATDPTASGSGLAAFPYDVQFKDGVGGVWFDWHIGANFASALFTGENEHTYCFRMRAADLAGNQQIYITSPTGDTCTTIDVDRPTAQIVSLSDFAQTKGVTVAWSGDDGAGGSGLASFDVQVKPSGGDWQPWLTAYPATSAVYPAPSDQFYSFRVAARDRAGNVGDFSAPASTRVDTSPPVCSVTVPYTTTTSLSTLALALACADPETGVVSYEVAVGTAPGIGDAMAPETYTTPPALLAGLTLENGGTYFVSARALNEAGSWSPWVSSAGVHILIPGPEAQVVYPGGILTTTVITPEFTAVDNLGYRVVVGDLQYRRAVFRYDALEPFEDWLTLPIDAGATNYTVADLIRGYAYEFRYRARNEVGSWGNYSGGGVFFVNQLPVAVAGPDRFANLTEEIVLDATGTIDYDGDRDTLTFTWHVDESRVADGITTRLSFSEPGTHRITLIVNDGHENATATVYVYVAPPAPRQILPGFEIPAVVLAAVAAVGLAGLRRRRAE